MRTFVMISNGHFHPTGSGNCAFGRAVQSGRKLKIVVLRKKCTHKKSHPQVAFRSVARRGKGAPVWGEIACLSPCPRPAAWRHCGDRITSLHDM